MSFQDLAERIGRVRDDIAAIQRREGLAGAVRIVAVTKGHPPAAVAAVAAAGIPDVGENRVHEALHKQEQLTGLTVQWHLIGHVQTNKAKLVPGRFALVHSVDSTRLGAALAKAAVAHAPGGRLAVLVQVNVAREDQKSGCAPESLGDVLGELGTHGNLDVCGLMTMAPFTDDERVQRRVFAALRELRDRHQTPTCPLPELSMGMSGDYPAAVAEGATLLRLGTVLLGERPQ